MKKQTVVKITLETSEDLPDAMLAGYCWGAVVQSGANVKVLDVEAGDYIVSRDYRK